MIYFSCNTQSLHFALETEKIHVNLFNKAQDAAKEGKDIELESVYICPIYGHTVLDEAPEKYPVCGTKKELYKKF